MTSDAVPVEARARKRDTAALAVGSGLSGVLAYVVFAVTTRALGPTDAAPVSVLWSYWSFAGAALTFPLQHWIATTSARSGSGAVRRALPRVALLVVVASLVVGAACWLVRDSLFHQHDEAFVGLVVLVTLGSAVVGVGRGGLTVGRHFRAVAASFAGENLIRVVGVAVLAVLGVRSPVGYGLCLVAGHLIVLTRPRALVFARSPQTTAPPNALAFLGASGAAQLMAQVVLTGAPVLLALAGGAAATVTAMFAALALFRAPYIVALGLVSQLTVVVAGLLGRHDRRGLRRIRLSIALGTSGLAVLGGAVAALVGPAVLRLVFGSRLEVGSLMCAAICVGCVLAVGSLVTTVTIMGRNRPIALVRAWGVALAGAAVSFVALTPFDPSARTVVAFVVAEAVALALLTLEQARAWR